MPALLLALLPLLGQIAPDLIGLAFGAAGQSTVGTKVEAAVRDIFGTTDATQVQAAAQADPGKLDTLKARLEADTQDLKAQLADVAEARQATAGLVAARSPIAWGSPVISAIVVVAFAIVAVVVFARYGVESAVGQLIAGALIAKFGTVVDYWLGSSRGASDRADQVTGMLQQAIVAGVPTAAPARRSGR